MEDRYESYEEEEESSDTSFENEECELRDYRTEIGENKDEVDEHINIIKKNNSFVNISRNKDSLVLLNLNIKNLYNNNFDINVKNDDISIGNKDSNKEKKIFQNLGDEKFQTIYTNSNEGKNKKKENNHRKEKRKNVGKNNFDNNKRNESSEINEAWQPGSELIRLEPILKIVKSICKIETNSGNASGFLIKFPPKYSPFYCLMSNEHVIEKEMIKNKAKIKIHFDNRNQSREINLTNNRIIKEFTNENDINSIDATVVQILPSDEISKEYFLEPNLDYLDNFNGLKSKEIVILQYPSLEEKDGIKKNYGILGLCFSGGIIEDISKFKLFHTATTYHGSSGSPIFLKNTGKVIGIHAAAAGIKKKNKNNNNDDDDDEILPNRGYLMGPIYKRIKKLSKNKFKLNKDTHNFKGNFCFNNNFFTRKNNNNRMKKKLNYSNVNTTDEGYFINNENEGNEKLMDYSAKFETELFNEKNKINEYLDIITKNILK